MKIEINNGLIKYLDKANYEYFRYMSLLNNIKRDFYPMTDEEWNSSMEYYQKLFLKSKIVRQTILETIEEIYSINFLNLKDWAIVFSESSLFTEEDVKNRPKERMRDFPNMLVDMYGDDFETPLFGAKDITLQVTDNCNMACTYCYQHNKQQHSMTFDTARQFIDQILDEDKKISEYCDFDNSIGFIINFIGGEPFLEINLITEISKYCLGKMFKMKHPKILKFMFNICSNGLNHFNPTVQEYLKTFDGYCSYSISIDGHKNLHDACRLDLNGEGTYDRVVLAVKDYLKTHEYIGNKMTLSPNNITHTYEAVKSLLELGYRDIYFNCVYEKGWTNEHATILYYQLKDIILYLKEQNLLNSVMLSMFSLQIGDKLDPKENQNWCGGTGKMIAMNYKGEFFPCLRYMETSSNIKNPLYIIGNINNGIGYNEETKERVNSLKAITRESQSTEECFNCPIASGCGHCSAYNYEIFGTPNKRTTFICSMHKARCLANFYYFYLLGTPINLNCPKEWAEEIIGKKEYAFLKEIQKKIRKE